MNPKAEAWLLGVVPFALVSLAFFLSAGTVNYGQAWFYPGVVAVSCIPLTRLIMNDPIVVESRTKMGPAAEQRPTQKVIILFMVLPGIALFIVTDLYQRFGWSSGRSGLS